MEAENETVVDKAVAFVKDMFGVHSDTEARARPEYADTAPEVTAEDAMRLDPNVFEGLVPPESGSIFVDEAERERRGAARFPTP